METHVTRRESFEARYGGLFNYELVPAVNPDDSIWSAEYTKWRLESGLDNINYENFNWKYYISSYTDLREAGITNKKLAWNHFTNHGIQEGRACIEGLYITNPGQWGCLKSHIQILERIVSDSNEGYTLILEDDVIVEPTYKTSLKIVDHIIKSNAAWKIIYLGGGQNEWENIKIENNYYHPINTTGTFAYIINNNFAKTVLRLFNNMYKPADVYLIDLQQLYKEDMYVVYPNSITCDLSHSTTGGTYHHKGTDYWRKRFKWS